MGPLSSQPGLRVSGGAGTSSRETQLSPTSAPSPTPAPGARAPRTLLAPSGAPPTHDVLFPLPPQPRRVFWPCSLAPFPPSLRPAVPFF